MSYFTMENEELKLVKTEELPGELEELYQTVRKKYIIQYAVSDWAEDTGDSGMGYDYNNSYELFREPHRGEIVVHNGNLVGFYVGAPNGIPLEAKATKQYFLNIEQDLSLCRCGSSSPRYGNSKEWTLHVKDKPSPLEYVCLMRVENKDREYIFTTNDFDCKFVESVSSVYKWEDSYGKFDGTFRVTLRLTKQGTDNPDAVLQELQAFKPVLVRE